MAVKLALLIEANKESTISAGEVELNPSKSPSLTEDVEAIYYPLGQEDSHALIISGPSLENPDLLANFLKISYFFPDEEMKDRARLADRAVNLAEAKVIHRVEPRKKAEPGWQWQYRLESGPPFTELRFYNSGFLPPFKSSDITIYIDHFVNYGCPNLYIVTDIQYAFKTPSYIESDWRIPIIEKEGFLDG